MRAVFCPNCGKEVEAGDRFCKYCSYNLSEYAPRNGSGVDEETISKGTKSTALAMVLSIILPGLGAYYIDGNTKGVIVFLISLVLLLLFGMPFSLLLRFILWIYGIKITSDSIDSYRQKYPL